ncbi:hypothetical protein RFI_12736 [Reticulomyxa filosa]|uniref:Uncharacterized protein n=1 Tax=Reticulomyxa filosa TaxID=46433 RepID=X6NEP0_RETFI|nr:hypothetical protein RFI_12736 [Reticulomyxa filosa]|eukprot:ETO24421.1 hypothetical protein RFI_12736 [Reticulomyxa filosa]
MLTLLYIVAGLIIAFSIPSYRDFFQLQKELANTLTLGGVAFAAYFGLVLLGHNVFHLSKQVTYGIFTPVFLTIILVCCLGTTLGVIYSNMAHLSKALHHRRLFIRGVNPNSVLHVFIRSFSISPIVPHSRVHRSIDLNLLLKDATGFDLFMEQLLSGSFFFF